MHFQGCRFAAPAEADLDWNDLKYLLAVAQHGSTLAAGRALEVDQATVKRRIAELERRIGLLLISRDRKGYRLTDVGLSLLEQAERVQEAIRGFEQQAAVARDGVVGIVRVTCPEPLALRLAQSALIEKFHALHPGLRVEFVLSDHYLDLTRGEADVALRSGDTDQDELLGRKIGDSLWALYASHGYVEKHGRLEREEDLLKHALVGFDESMKEHRAAVWLRAVAPEGLIVVRNNSVLGLVNSARAGLGVTPLPTVIGNAESDLVQVLGPIKALSRIWRVLTTSELRRQARVSEFFDYMVNEVEALRPIITG